MSLYSLTYNTYEGTLKAISSSAFNSVKREGQKAGRPEEGWKARRPGRQFKIIPLSNGTHIK